MYPIESLTEYLKQFVTPNRYQLFQKILEYRTRYITVVLENIYQPQNASAVVRSCDCFGIQDIHAIENSNQYIIDKEVAMGADKYLTIIRHQSVEANELKVMNDLKRQGYRIVATTPHAKDAALEEFDLSKGKVALFFGQNVIDNADEYLKIPMYGFTESFNISVSASIVLHHLNLQLRKSDIAWGLTPKEKELLTYQWTKASIKKVDLILKKYCQEHHLNYHEISLI
jgi:tRNA (guanosine-2'-O-)-methyltransferase